MAITIESYIESISNCAARFRTLRGVHPLLDSEGNPVFTAGSRTVAFRLRGDGQKYLLRCPLAMSGREKALAEKYALEIRHLNNPFLTPCDYLSRELLAYNTRRKAVWSDIMIERETEGEPFLSFVRSRLMRSDRQPFRDLLRNIAAMAANFHDNGIIHGNLKYGNIIVRGSGSPVALNYQMSHDKRQESDTAGLAMLAVSTYIAACEPSLFAHIPGNILPPAGSFIPAPGHIKIQAEFLRNEPLRTLAEILIRRDRDRVKLNRALTALADFPFTRLPLLAGLAGEAKGTLSMSPHNNPFPKAGVSEDATLNIDFRKCDFTAPAADTVIRFRIGAKWDYADRYGNRITNSGFIEAEDFYEGRAVVTTEEGAGMIDRGGEFVMEPRYETVEWHGKENVASACADGKWELYDRMGKQLTAGGYDWMSDCSEGTFLARRGNKFGYLNTDGSNLTDMRFDDAYSFRNGTSTVKVGTEIYRIDREGHKIT